MADAPSGGSSWGAIEIILVAAIVLAILSRVFGTSPSLFGDTATNTPTAQPVAETGCTVSLTSPKPLEQISDTAVVTGAIKGCANTNGVQPKITGVVVDGAGMPLSAITTMNTSYVDIENKLPFAATIKLTARSSTKNGYVIVSANGFTESGATARIPVTFAR